MYLGKCQKEKKKRGMEGKKKKCECLVTKSQRKIEEEK